MPAAPGDQQLPSPQEVFISYSRKDTDFVRRLDEAPKSRGREAWVDWLPIFVSEAACKIVTESLNFCHRQKGLRINAYVIMPTHLHAILFHVDFQAKAVEQVVTDFRKFTGRRLADFCAQHMPA